MSYYMDMKSQVVPITVMKAKKILIYYLDSYKKCDRIKKTDSVRMVSYEIQ